MKAYAIRDKSIDKNRDLAYLLYYEKTQLFHIEVCDKTGEWEAPLILSSFVKRGKRSLDSYWSREWVEQRIIPRDRQNLGMILKENGLREYDVIRLLEIAGGRCAQDECFIVPLKKTLYPQELKNRLKETITDAITDEERIIAFYRDGAIVNIDKNRLPMGEQSIKRMDAYSRKIGSLHVGDGGHSLILDDSFEITAEELKNAGKTEAISTNDMTVYIKRNLIDTSAAAEMLHCTRQNIQDLVTRKKLEPVMTLGNSFLFLKEQIYELSR